MTDLNRRSLVKLAAGMAMGAAATGTGTATADESDFLFPARPADGKAKDEALQQAINYPYSYMFSEQVNVKLEGDRHSRDMVITSALDANQRATKHYIRSGTMRIFRANADLDEFTKQGGLYWRFNGKDGTVQFKKAGAVVMVVRDHDDNVRFYTLQLDLRC